MKIKEIRRKDLTNIYEVDFTPNWFEKLFGIKDTTKSYKDTGGSYMFGGGSVYMNSDCEQLGNSSDIGRAIDKFRNKWQ